MAARSTMKAWRYAKGTTARTLVGQLQDSLNLHVDVPVPSQASLGPDQFLVEVFSAALNPVDYKIPESDWLGKTFGLGPDAQPGLDFSGRIVGAHSSPSSSSAKFSVGQLVFGSLAKASRHNALAEYTVATSSELAPWPDEALTADEAAAMGTSAGTAYQSLLLLPDLPESKGRRVFINGGSGGVGTFTVQLAKMMGADVTATTSSANADLVKSLGAQHVIDYRKGDVIAELSSRGDKFDLVIDNAGAPENLYGQSGGFLKPDGAYMQVAANPSWNDSWPILKKVAVSMIPGCNRPRFRFVAQKGTGADLARLGQWAAEGKLRPIVGERVAFENVPAAYRKLREGHCVGKMVVCVKENTGKSS